MEDESSEIPEKKITTNNNLKDDFEADEYHQM